MPVQVLRGTADLASVLRLATLSVVLFTAPWSQDSVPALEHIRQVAATFPPSVEPPYIAFYAVPLEIAQVHQKKPEYRNGLSPLEQKYRGAAAIPDFIDRLMWAENDELYQNDMRLYNATANIPWFPAIRLFVWPRGSRGPNVQNDSPLIATFYNSFTISAIREFIVNTSLSLLASSNDESTSISSTPEQLALGTTTDASGYVAVPSSGEKEEKTSPSDRSGEMCPSPGSESHVPLSVAHLRSIQRRADAPITVSPDQFSTAVLGTSLVDSSSTSTTSSATEDPRLAALLFIPQTSPSAAGIAAWGVLHKGVQLLIDNKQDKPRYRSDDPALTLGIAHDVVNAANTSGARTWIASTISAAAYAAFARSYSIDLPSTPTTDDAAVATSAVLLVDAVRDNAQVLTPFSASSHSPESVRDILSRFASAAPGTLRAPRPLRQLGRDATRGPAVVPVDSADAYIAAERAAACGPVWIVVHQKWCGFSQRLMALYAEFAEVAPPGVSVLEITDVDALPGELDHIVDGFPTVLRPRTKAGKALCLRRGLGEPGSKNRCALEEYLGPHIVIDLLRIAQKELGHAGHL